MAGEGFVPSWIQPADEVGHLAQGYQVGMALGARQAEQAFREQQMMRQQQLDAQQKAQWEAEFGLQSAAAARKAAAIQAYQADIAAGVDPVQAIVKHGPAIGLPGGTEAAALRSMQLRQKPPVPMAGVVELPEFPGVKFLKQPTGHLQVVNSGDLTKDQKLRLGMEAQRMMQLGPQELPTDPSYQQRTNFAQNVLGQVIPPPVSGKSKTNEVQRTTKDGRIAIFDADTKKFLRYEE